MWRTDLVRDAQAVCHLLFIDMQELVKKAAGQPWKYDYFSQTFSRVQKNIGDRWENGGQGLHKYKFKS